ncbi:MAG TPA: hypothetical protein VGD58_18605 [Herpetosiphonaceae bacterium]
MPQSRLDVEAIVSEIMQSPKYKDRPIARETVRDLVVMELGHYKKEKDLVKAVRKKLHRIVAAYLGDPDYAAATLELSRAADSGSADQLREACARLLEVHLSTRERLPIYDQFYAGIFEVTGRPSSLMDVACGLNPLSFPWMRLPATTRYYAYDINQQRVDLLNHAFVLQGLAPLARVQDVLVEPPCEQADVAFLFKEVHRLEARQRGSSLRLLEALPVRWIAVSLPAQSSGGHHDLRDRHRQLMAGIVAGQPWASTELEFESELVFCIDKLSDGLPAA